MSSAWNPGSPAPNPEDIVSCVACGLCLPHCPTFRLTGRETASPRGRIAAMRAVEEGVAEVDESFRTMMDECLACRACETACPSGVPFGRMVEAARAQAEVARPEPGRRGRRLGLSWALRRPRVVTGLGWAGGLAQAVRADRLLPSRLRDGQPRVSLAQMARPLRSRGTGPRAAVMTGCVMSVAHRDVHRATIDAVAAAGFEAVPIRGCCGALSMHHGYPEAARDMAKERIRDLAGFDLVVMNAAGCSGHIKGYGELLADDPEWAERAARVAARTRDVVELEYVVRRGSPGAVAMHDACHHLNGQGIAAEPRRLLAKAGAEVRELGDGGRCCGAAGLYAVTQPELSSRLRRQKAEAIVATDAPVVSVANAGCAMQIERGLAEMGADVRVAHPVQIARASRTSSA